MGVELLKLSYIVGRSRELYSYSENQNGISYKSYADTPLKEQFNSLGVFLKEMKTYARAFIVALSVIGQPGQTNCYQ